MTKEIIDRATVVEYNAEIKSSMSGVTTKLRAVLVGEDKMPHLIEIDGKSILVEDLIEAMRWVKDKGWIDEEADKPRTKVNT